MSKILMSLAGFVGILMLVSCTAGGPTASNDPLIPTAPPVTAQSDISPTDSSGARGSARSPNHYLWGYYLFYVDPQKDEIEIVPVRELETHLNVLGWLEKGPCTNCVSVVAVTPGPNDTKLFDVRFKHPFPSKNLTGFDVRGIVMFAGSHMFPVSSLTTPDKGQGDGELVNADGFTTLYNGSTAGSGPGGLQGYMKGKFASATPPDAKLNGYKRHISSGSANTRNAFYAGDSITVTYQLDMPDSQFIFGYAVDASWAPPTVKPVQDPMTDFPPEANCYEPWKVEVDNEPIHLGLNTQGGSNTLTIAVYDWQGKDSHYAPLIECPELFDGAQTATWSADGTGYSEWTGVVSNDKLAAEGDYKCLIKVVDNENAGSPPYLDLTAYQVVTLTVVPWTNVPPVAVPGADSLLVAQLEPLHFFDNGSFDPDGGSIVNWEWDWDNNGTYDETGSDTLHLFAMAGYFTIAYRVTDDEGSTGTANMVIHSDAPPVAKSIPELEIGGLLGIPISFSGSPSSDPDGSIVKYEWDYDYDWATFMPDEEGMDVSHAYDTAGWHIVNLRVTDDFGITATLSCPIYVSIGLPGSTITWGGTGEDRALDMDYDSDGNIYVAGSFSGTVDFDPGSGVAEYTATGSSDMFLCKFDPSGTLIWVAAWGGTGLESIKGISVSADSGDTTTEVYVSGCFTGTVDFDPGPTPFNLTSNSDSLDAYVSKFDGDGAFQYALGWGGVGTDEGMDVVTSSFFDIGGFLVTGIFQDTVDLDPGPGTQIFVSKGGFDISLSRFESDGSVMWLETIGGPGDDISRAVVSRASAIPAVVGSFSGTVDFDPGSGTANKTSAGGKDAFMADFDNEVGSLMDAITWGGPGDDEAEDYAGTSAGFIVTGYSSAGADFDPGPGSDIPPNNGGTDAFLSMYNYMGGYTATYVWGDSSDDYAFGVSFGLAADKRLILVAGAFEGTVDFDPSGEVDEHVSNGSTDAFISAYDLNLPSGDITYSRTVTMGGTGQDWASDIEMVYPSFNISTIGVFSDTVDFDPSINADNRTSNGILDCFLQMLTPELQYE